MPLATWRLGAIVACVLGIALPVLADDKGSDKGKDGGKKEIAWAKSFDEAVKAARKADKPIMIDFYTDWCVWCKRLDADTYPDPKVVAVADRFVAVKLDAEDHKEGEKVFNKYKAQVEGFPTILFLNPRAINPDEAKPGRADVLGKIVGYEKPGPFADDIKKFAESYAKLAASYRELPDLKKKYEGDRKDLATLGKLVVAYHDQADAEKARDLLKEGEAQDADNAKGCLTRAYNAVADDYQSEGDDLLEKAQEAKDQGDRAEAKKLHDQAVELVEKALLLYQKAARTGKDPADVYYARKSIAACYISEGKFTEGYQALKASLKVAGGPAEDKKKGEEILQQLESYMKQHGIATGDK